MSRSSSRVYRGEYREIAELVLGETTLICKPEEATIAEHRHRVHNAVAWFTESRKRHFQCQTDKVTGTVRVTRVERDADGARIA